MTEYTEHALLVDANAEIERYEDEEIDREERCGL